MATTNTPHRIAVIPGDGIGKEVVPEGIRVLEAVGRRFGIGFSWHEFDWSCDYYARHGRMMPEDWFEQLSPHDAIYFGAVGWPATVPDHVSLWGSLIQYRRRFEDAQALGQGFRADAVAGDRGDAVLLVHVGLSFTSSVGRTTRATPITVSATPAIMGSVSDSPNSSHAISAVQGGTR